MVKWNARYHDIHKHHSLIDKVWALDNLERASKHVLAKKGSPGIDGVSVYRFGKDAGRELLCIQRQLREGSYSPRPVKRIYIQNGSKMRPIGIPTVKDRVVQQAVRQVIEPIFEKTFAPESYGYRPNRGALDAVEMARGRIQEEGYRTIADLDIKGFFDHLDHDILLDLVNEKISDGRVLALIRKFLEAGVVYDGCFEDGTVGTPQGGVISPVLANIYLNHLDRRLKAEGYVFVRYADDIVIFEKRKTDAHRALDYARYVLRHDLKLELSEEKTSVFYINNNRGLEYLGHHIFLKKVQPTKKAISRFKDKVRFLTRRQQGKKVEYVINRLNPLIRGWGNYFVNTTVKKLYWDLDFWIQRRIRSYMTKRWRLSTTKAIPTEKLLGLGLITFESVMNIPYPLIWRLLREQNHWT